MTNPQNELYNLSYRIQRLTEMFKTEDGEEDIFAIIKQMHTEVVDLMESHQRLENQMALIIKLLIKLDTG